MCVNDRVWAMSSMPKTSDEMFFAANEVGNNPGTHVSGVCALSPLLRLPYWDHEAMVAMGISHFLLLNTTKKFMKKVGADCKN